MWRQLVRWTAEAAEGTSGEAGNFGRGEASFPPPALIQIPLAPDLAHLNRCPEGAVGRCRKVCRGLRRHLFLVRAAGQRFRNGASVEARQAGIVIEPEQGNERGRDVHITHRRMHGGAALEVDAPGQEGIAYGPWAHAAVVARIAFQRTGGATGVALIGPGPAV